ncbi:acetyl-CoA carboxylase biotin carboxyl carrier protein [Aerococcaceae bacterium INB8]|uniref:Biotin carboxyl carrier protein of acetyl-CoA carboxylase n=1 Tax=Ruoffia halotolerans TaxID=2748684 RepID=A0A839A5F3_9LACT|nr:acetyl-CoA carboxylase biotin carboxyl carrier protein [Ruoffia halotolerans]
MNQEQLLSLIDKLDQSSLAFLNYESDDVKLVLSKEMPKEAPVFYGHQEESKPAQTPTVEQETAPNQIDEAKPVTNDTDVEEGVLITSPMVGVVYLQPNPDSEAFVKVGDTVSEGDTVVIIEAMKLMNEIQANHSGTVVEILVENETVVEFGQPIMRIN